MKKQITIFQMLLIMLLTASVTMVLTFYYTESRIVSRLSSVSEAQQLFVKLHEVKRCVDANYVGDHNADMLADGAVEGYLAALGDKWTYYLTAEEYEATAENLSGGYTGIGIRTAYDVDATSMHVAEVYEDSTAEKAGLLAGDEILYVNDKSVADVGYDGAKALLQGEVGTAVRLGILRNGESMEFSVTRAYVREEIVTSRMLSGKVGYIRVKDFATGADVQFRTQLAELRDDGAQSYIIDMRNNGGGELEVLLDIMDRVLPRCVSMISEDRRGVREEYNSDAESLSAPIAVLVNKNTYGAAEYFAAVLQEYGKAVVVGEKTSGKGFGQATVKLSDGSAVVLSTVSYFTPQLRSLASSGCVPNETVALGDPSVLTDNRVTLSGDEQLARAHGLLTAAG